MGTGGTLELRLAGPFRASVAGRTLTDDKIGGRRARLLLAALAFHGRPLSRDELADVLWSGDLPPTWGSALRVAASKVRTALVELLGEGADVAATGAGYELRLPTDVVLEVDLLTARDQVEAAEDRLAAGDARGAIDSATSARAVLVRPVLGDDGGAWAERRRDEARELLVRALEALGRARLAIGEPTPAAATGADALELEPYRESVHRLVIAAHDAAGNRGEALRAYERCRRMLADELGVAPDPETDALYRRILGEEPAGEADPPLPGRLRLVGRRRALQTLDQLLDAAVAGQGGVALVTGEPGIGKTRIARELAERAAVRGARPLWGTCREPEWAPPFGAIVDLLPELLAMAPPELAERLAARLLDADEPVPADDRLRVREDLRRAVLAAAQVAPIVLILDDLQWADDATVGAIRQMAPSLPTNAVLVVATMRDEEVALEGSVAGAVTALVRDAGAVRIELPALDEAAVAELVASVRPDAPPELASTLRVATGGNPFYVEAALLHALEAGDLLTAANGAPSAVRDVVSRRVNRMNTAGKALVRAASLFEGAFRLDAVAVAAELAESDALDAVDEALAACLVVPSDRPDTYEFAHAIARHAIAAAIPPSRRVRLHRRIAEAIEATAAGTFGALDAGEVAGQYHRSASLQGASAGVEHALRAADHADATGAADRAATYLGMALDLLPDHDDRRATITARRGLALLAAARYEEGAAIVVTAADTMIAAGDTKGAAALLADGAWAGELAGSTRVAYALASAGLPLVADGPEDDVWARLYLLDLRRQEADDPRGLGIPIATPERRRAARMLHADTRFRGDMAWGVWDRRDEILASGTDDVWALTMWAGRYEQALPMWQRAATAAEARGQIAEAVNAWAGAAGASIALGYLADADQMTERARQLARRIDLHGAFALHLAGARDLLVAARGDGYEELIDWVAELTVQRTDPAQRWAEAGTFAALARGLALNGRDDDAAAMLDGVVDVLPAAPAFVVAAGRTVGDAVAAAWFVRDRRHLGVLADATERILVEPDFRCPMCEPRLTRARVLGLAGELDEARTWFAAARAVAAEDATRPLAAIIDHDEALLLLRAGRSGPDATELLQASGRLAAELGMVGWVRRAEQLALGRVS